MLLKTTVKITIINIDSFLFSVFRSDILFLCGTVLANFIFLLPKIEYFYRRTQEEYR